ncbi:uncharacterized protein H6S33_013162 [Morchella sextelata]|uniref:uncharacterized protein n=1 Tax=Morchella sextelata TaxID=1174677 RepID=UPI001D052BEB|nr:uncharacterized protein H6S33_013162 [Morchella sextelata]KAH0609676.1 hypothetical protein H6S33_013162 [Morchella sextelata]
MKKPTNAVLLGVLLSLAGCAEAFGPQKTLLSRIDSLTLRSDMMTKGRRVDPIPQLKCVGGDGMGRYEVDVMRCKNRGSDYGDENISWSCTADLPREFKLGATDVICEGYDSPDDNYILKGSCGVEYRLALTDYGYEKYRSSAWTNRFTNDNSTSTNITLFIFWTIFFSILGWIIYSAYTSASTAPRAPRTAGGARPSFWGGGGGGGGDDPPPPYDYSNRKPQQQRQGPGFWTGAATGAAAGAAATRLFSGSGSSGRERAPPPPAPSYSGASWGGGGGERGESSSAGARHSSTGFGQTRRR